jgi:DNA-binding response OmpR family regulator
MARILVIDDCRTVLSSVHAALHLDGHQVEGLELLVALPRLLRERPPDLILLDLQMPGVSGLKLGQLLKGMSGGDVPVCVYSSRPRRELQAAAQEMGAVASLEKGRPMTELRHLVTTILRRATRRHTA